MTRHGRKVQRNSLALQFVEQKQHQIDVDLHLCGYGDYILAFAEQTEHFFFIQQQGSRKQVGLVFQLVCDIEKLKLDQPDTVFRFRAVKNRVAQFMGADHPLHLFGPVYDYLWSLLLQCPYTQHDETVLQVLHDGRNAGRMSYMWLYMTSELWEDNPVIIFSYEKTRKADHLRTYFRNYSGNMTCDAYSGYYTFRNENTETIALGGCLMHARRPLANSMKLAGAGKMTEEEKAALPEYPLLQILGKIFDRESGFKSLSAASRKEQRDRFVRPLVDEYFDMIHSLDPDNPEYREEMKKGIRYSLNHEPELRRFLDDGHIPAHNGACERHIRPFACSRKAWLFCNTVSGAEASAILYTLVETAKASHADVYYYLKYLLDTMPKHKDGTDRSFLPDMMPWSQAFRKYDEEQRQSAIERYRLNPCADPPESTKYGSGPPGQTIA